MVESLKLYNLLKVQIRILNEINQKLDKLAGCVDVKGGILYVETNFDPPLVYRTIQLSDEEYEKITGIKRRRY
jgi:hypothetical protein